MPAKQITTVLDFLIRTGLVHQQGSTLSAGVNIIRLGNDSHLIYKHHTNWRLQAVDSLEKESLTDLHYSAVLTLSSADIQKIKDLLLEQLKANLEIVKTSHEEEICVLNIDFFNLKKGIEE